MTAFLGKLGLLLALMASMLGFGSSLNADGWSPEARSVIQGWVLHPPSILVDPPGQKVSTKSPSSTPTDRTNLALQKKRATDGDGAPPKGRQSGAFLPSTFPVTQSSPECFCGVGDPRPLWRVHQGLEAEQGGQNGPPSRMASA